MGDIGGEMSLQHVRFNTALLSPGASEARTVVYLHKTSTHAYFACLLSIDSRLKLRVNVREHVSCGFFLPAVERL